MTRRPSRPVARQLFVGIDALLVVLVVVAVVQAPAVSRWAAVAVALVLLAVYAWGRRTVRVHERPVDAPRGAWWPDAAWVVGLAVPWAALLWLSPGALWIAFPLMLLQMHVLGPRRGLVAVMLTTALSVAAGLAARVDDGPWIGYVLGPVIGAAVAVGAVLGLEAIVRESQARQRAAEELMEVRRHLALAERERAVASERERLAREIHDTLAQSLSAIELLLRTAGDAVGSDDVRARSLISSARDAAADSLAEARRFVRDLAPAELERTSLVGAVRRVAERVAATGAGSARGAGGLDVRVHVAGEARQLPVPLETALLRIVQSALANVLQHSGASRADVTLSYADDLVLLDVVDDGRGFSPEMRDDHGAGSFGLSAMRSRVAELGGTLSLEASPGEGTALAVALPVPADQEGP